MKYLVTGVNGVVGSNIFMLLSEIYGFDIWGCGRNSSDSDKYFCLDLNDKSAVLELFLKERFDCVIHCAANINNNANFEMFRNNISSTLNIVEVSLLSGVKKIFHTSGVPVIGEILDLPIAESHPVKPPTAYLLSKYQSEQLIEHFCKGKIDFINMRIPSPVGKNMPSRSIFPFFLEKIKKGENITLKGNPLRKQNYLDLRDLASFIYKSNLVEGVSGVYNVAAKKPYTDMELAKTIISRTGSSSKIINEMTECNTGIHSWDISILKAKEHFGYVPEYDLYQMIDWVL